MKTLSATLFVLLLGVMSGACSGDRAATAARTPATPPRLRVMTYNIHHGEGADGRFDLSRIARVITDQSPDLVALQEVDVKTERSGGVDQAAELGRLTGMRVTFGRALDYQGGQYGQAILSRVPLEDFRVHVLPGHPDRERRAAVAAFVRPWGKRGPRIRFVGTHLHHQDEEDRLAQAAELNRLFAGDGGPVPTVLLGDLNARPGSMTMEILLSRWADAGAEGGAGDAGTFPSDSPDRRIDYILLRPREGWRVVETRVVEEKAASDHRPVVSVVEWTGVAKRD